LSGGAGDDVINGGADHDSLNGDAGNDTLDGGAGNDTSWGGVGNNTFRFGRGDGIDWIGSSPNDTTAGKLNTLAFKTGVAPTDLVLRQITSNVGGAASGLEISIAGTTDKVQLEGFMVGGSTASGYNPVQRFTFANGTVWNLAAIQAALFAGNVGADTLTGTLANDTIGGGAGNDTLSGGAGDDVINGGADNDQLNGDAGNDTLDGGAGNDTSWGGVGNNTFRFGRGDGIDWIGSSPNDTTAGKLNTLAFKTGVAPTDLVLRQITSNVGGAASGLEISIAGTTDKVQLEGFMVGGSTASGYNPVQRFTFANGTVWNLAAIL
jgi:Ca2+-binding RTX toxin-like protein